MNAKTGQPMEHFILLNLVMSSQIKMSVKILQASQTDLEAILRLQKECYIAEAELYNDYKIAPLRQDIKSLEKEFETSLILKAVLGETIIGSIRGCHKKGTLFIGKLIVDKNFQNQGIGQRLLKSIESEINVYERSELFTGFRSEKNLYLYSKNGYVEFKREKINENMTLIFLEKYKNGLKKK